MNVLSCFDGISCGMVALKRAGIPVTNYFASEIDPYAIKISRKNFPEIVQLGDVRKVSYNTDSIEVQRESNSWLHVARCKVDLIICGSPCQGFSIAGDGLNFDDPRSKLFFEFVRILKEVRQHNPDVKFMLENVKMKADWRNIITKYLGVEPISINASLVSAQHRDRYFWTNIQGIAQPEDRKVFVGDIMEKKVNEKYYLSITALDRLVKINRRAKEKGLGYKDCITRPDQKFLNLDANYFKGADGKRSVLLGENTRVRHATPLECERLQCLEDNYTDGISNTQRYKTLGNGWNIDVITHIFKNLKK